jgi:peptidoglycan/xylan/chitin deacetylase (PgdA/CDA1 family)
MIVVILRILGCIIREMIGERKQTSSISSSPTLGCLGMARSEKMSHKCIVTTSWDDGHVLDTRLANILRKHEIGGTFYLSTKIADVWQNIRPEIPFQSLTEEGLVQLSKDFEIGAHTLHHSNLLTIPSREAEEEITKSKQALEDVLGKKIFGFCYPYGAFNNQVIGIVKKVGYKYARTTNKWQTRITDPFLMGTTIHVHSHNWISNMRNLRVARPILGKLHDWRTLAKIIFDHVYRRGGIYHLWGHSWEIERFHLWNELEGFLDYISNRRDAVYLTNHETILLTCNGKLSNK